MLLAFAWAACPYTAFALESNTNDSLVSPAPGLRALFLSSPPVRGGLIALASLTKFAPLALVPLFATYGARPGPRRPDRSPGAASCSGRSPPRCAVVTLVVMAETLLDPGLSTFWDRTIGNQAGRDSPFSVWGQEPSLRLAAHGAQGPRRGAGAARSPSCPAAAAR